MVSPFIQAASDRIHNHRQLDFRQLVPLESPTRALAPTDLPSPAASRFGDGALPLIGGTVNGVVTIHPDATGTPPLRIDDGASIVFAGSRVLYCGSLRCGPWGTAAGTNGDDVWFLNAYNDSGTFVAQPFAIARTNGATTFKTQVGFNSAAPIAKPTVTGAKGSNAALASLLTALASTTELVTDGARQKRRQQHELVSRNERLKHIPGGPSFIGFPQPRAPRATRPVRSWRGPPAPDWAARPRSAPKAFPEVPGSGAVNGVAGKVGDVMLVHTDITDWACHQSGHHRRCGGQASRSDRIGARLYGSAGEYRRWHGLGNGGSATAAPAPLLLNPANFAHFQVV